MREPPRILAFTRESECVIQPLGTSMDLNRHQFLFIGLIVLLVGLQFHYVSAYILNPEATQFLAERTGQSTADISTVFAVTSGTAAAPRKVLEPPDWLAWCLMSVGAVLCLHSLAMPRPG
jgi:hypothetical protein